jgi:hypothetical protein
MARRALAPVLALCLAACDESRFAPLSAEKVRTERIVPADDIPDVYVVEDGKRGVVCYITRSHDAISCVVMPRAP